VLDALIKLQKKIERESPGRLIGKRAALPDDSGTQAFLRAPNKAVPTTRSHEFIPPGEYED
jgi:hypothetical protein